MADLAPRPRRFAPEQLVPNARGLALAAFGSVDAIARLLGCSEDDAAAFQQDAQVDWRRLRVAVAHAKKKLS